MAADKFEEWWREKGNLYECLDYEAKEIWDTAIKSVEVQKPSHNNRSDEIAFLESLVVRDLWSGIQQFEVSALKKVNDRIAQLRAVR